MGLVDKNFPAGLRVLMVDNDTIYLNLMKNILEKCKYNVTTTNQVREALRMLKENKKCFDIMITNDEMMDMDSLKLLQIVKLETNLPVIMLSSYNDIKRVIRWIDNGACDCLVKPVGIHDLQHIWKHAYKSNKSICKRSVYNPPDVNTPSGALISSTSQYILNKGKGVEESSGDNNNIDENLEEGDPENNEDITIQKKPRFKWSDELHQKFVDAVNQLGLNKAFPKKIVEVMNVKDVTRDKVASHLQKYKLNLQKLDSRPNQEENKFNALEKEDVNIGSLGGGYGVYRSLSGKRMFSELNTTTNLSLGGLSSFPMLQAPQPPNSFNNFESFNSPNLLANRNNNLIPNSSEASLYGPPTNSIMLSANPPLTPTEYGFQSSSLFPSSSTLESSNTNSSTNFPNWGTLQSNPILQNELSSNDSDNIIAFNVTSIQNYAQDNVCGIPSFNESVQNISFDNIGQRFTWHNQSPDYVAGNIEMQNNENMMDASPFTCLEGYSSNNEVQKPNNEDGHVLLDDLKFFSSSGSQSSSGYLDDVIRGLF